MQKYRTIFNICSGEISPEHETQPTVGLNVEVQRNENKSVTLTFNQKLFRFETQIGFYPKKCWNEFVSFCKEILLNPSRGRIFEFGLKTKNQMIVTYESGSDIDDHYTLLFWGGKYVELNTTINFPNLEITKKFLEYILDPNNEYEM